MSAKLQTIQNLERFYFLFNYDFPSFKGQILYTIEFLKWMLKEYKTQLKEAEFRKYGKVAYFINCLLPGRVNQD